MLSLNELVLIANTNFIVFGLTRHWGSNPRSTASEAGTLPTSITKFMQLKLNGTFLKRLLISKKNYDIITQEAGDDIFCSLFNTKYVLNINYLKVSVLLSLGPLTTTPMAPPDRTVNT
jgi:hypothetical protein